MNQNPLEIARVAQAEAAAQATEASPQAPRVDMYAGIHKAMRALMADTLLAVGRMDADDDLERAQTCNRVQELLDFCIAHLGHENEFVHPAIEARAPGASELIAHEHGEHEREIAALSAVTARVLDCAAPRRSEAAQDLYRRLALFMAHNFEHMNIEETAHNAVLWARYTDAELIDLHNQLVASIAPAEMMFVIRWMVPFMNPAERAMMMSDMQRHAPAPAFEAALDVVRPHLGQREWAKLMQALGRPAVPGLVG